MRGSVIWKSIEELPEMTIARAALCFPYNGRYVVIGGNRRLEAQRALKRKEVPIISLPENTPVEKLRRIALLDNESTGETDWNKIAKEWNKNEIKEWNIQTPKGWFNEISKRPIEEDSYDILSNKKNHIQIKLGDIYQLGKHRLMCGDSTDINHVNALMGGEKANLWITDPPYNVGYGMEGSQMMSKRKHRTDGKIVLNDRQTDSQFIDFLTKSYRNADEVMLNGASFYIFHADNEGYNFRLALRNTEHLIQKQTLIWLKDSFCLGRQDYQWIHEPCLYGWKEGASHKWYNDRCQTTVIKWNRPKKSEEHPTMKPIGLFAYLIGNSTQENDIVLDSFAGSGTTIMACEQLNRKSRCMELDPAYCEIIILRWEEFTGEKAKKISRG